MLSEKVADLESTISDFAQEPNLANLSSTQQALKSAWLAWQDVSLFVFGPSETAGLRASLATYPTDTDKIEGNIASGSYILGSIDNKAAVGFPALDYLLNGQAGDAQGIVDQFTLEPDAAQRLAYLTDLIAEINNKVEATESGWLASGENYLADFTSASAAGTDVGSSLGQLVNAMDLHFQRFVRDGKVAIPAGIRSAGVPRPKAVEVYYGGYSVELLLASLNAYQRLFQGTALSGEDHTGLYEYLVVLNAKELADDVQQQFAASITAAQGLSDPLSEQIESDVDAVTDVFLELQKIVVLLKSDMASTMGITITNQDNDGD